MIQYTIGQLVTYGNKKWIIDSFTADGNGQTQAILRRGCYREIVDIERLEDFGKTVFLTREEAEQALKERENNAN